MGEDLWREGAAENKGEGPVRWAFSNFQVNAEFTQQDNYANFYVIASSSSYMFMYSELTFDLKRFPV